MRNTQEQRSSGTRDLFYFHVQSKVHGIGDEPIPSLQRYRYMTHINMANNIDFCLPVHNYDFWGYGVFFLVSVYNVQRFLNEHRCFLIVSVVVLFLQNSALSNEVQIL